MSSVAHKQLSKNPQYAAFTRVVIELMGHLHPEDTISVICDDEEETALTIYQLYRKIKLTYPEARRKLVSLSLADDKVFVQLQAADMIASLTRLEARRKFLQERFDYTLLTERLDTRLKVRTQADVMTGFYGKEQLSNLSSEFEAFETKYGKYGVTLVEEKDRSQRGNARKAQHPRSPLK
jgi:hypothetical protein